MTDYISREAFLADKKWLYCTDCEKRKGKKRGKTVTLYEIGEAPCKSCGIHDMLEEVEDYPAADVVPKDFHERCLEIEIQKRLALEKSAVESTIAKGKLNLFARWVAKKVVDENFEMDAGAFAEVCCRKLRHLGIVTDDEDNWIFTPTHADDIRSMSDEELATMIATLQIAQTMARQDEKWWLDWLKQEVK